MALNFEYEKDIETGGTPFMCHEPNSVIYNYYIDDERAMDTHGTSDKGFYENFTFGNAERHLTTRAVSRIGVKNFPGIGGTGFFRDAYSDDCFVVAPIHVEREKKDAPILSKVESVDNKLHIVISPPQNLEYPCYRVVCRQEAFAFEYILYKTDYYVDIPTVKGTYMCYCIGYDEDNAVVSEQSNVLTLVVTTGASDWAPHFDETADIEQRVADLEADVGDIGAVLDDINGVEV